MEGFVAFVRRPSRRKRKLIQKMHYTTYVKNKDMLSDEQVKENLQSWEPLQAVGEQDYIDSKGISNLTDLCPQLAVGRFCPDAECTQCLVVIFTNRILNQYGSRLDWISEYRIMNSAHDAVQDLLAKSAHSGSRDKYDAKLEYLATVSSDEYIRVRFAITTAIEDRLSTGFADNIHVNRCRKFATQRAEWFLSDPERMERVLQLRIPPDAVDRDEWLQKKVQEWWHEAKSVDPALASLVEEAGVDRHIMPYFCSYVKEYTEDLLRARDWWRDYANS